MKIAILITSLCLVFLCGCLENAPKAESGPRPVTVENTTRFNIESHGTFNAGYDRHEREILLITDCETGRKYLGVTGVGVTELFQEQQGKTNVTTEE